MHGEDDPRPGVIVYSGFLSRYYSRASGVARPVGITRMSAHWLPCASRLRQPLGDKRRRAKRAARYLSLDAQPHALADTLIMWRSL